MLAKTKRKLVRNDALEVQHPAMLRPRRFSLVDQAVDSMRQSIDRRLWKDELPGEDALTKQLGISRVTLRKALAQLAGQGWITLGGRGRKHAITRKSESVVATRSAGGVVRCLTPFPELEMVWSTRIIFDEIRRTLAGRGCGLEFEQRPGLWRGDPAERLVALLALPDTDVWLLYRASKRIQRWFQENRVPCVVLGPCHDGVALPSAQSDVTALGRHAAAESLRLGHHHLAYVVYDPNVASSMATLKGLREVRAKDGTPATVTVISDDETVDGLRSALSGAMAMKDPPTLLLVTEANQTLPVLGILREMGLRVPEDVSVIIRDHEPYLARSVPELTRYSFDWIKFGRNAGRLLSSVMESGSGKNTMLTLLPEFIRGKTLAARRAR